MKADPELEYRIVPITQVASHPAHPRTNPGDIDELTPSIEALGVLIAPVVIPAEPVVALWPDHAGALAGKDWVLLSGHRRMAALTQAANDDGDTTVAVTVRRDGLAYDPAAQLTFMRTDNVARAPLTPMDEARSFQQALKTGLSQRQIARQSGCSQPHVSRRLALMKLPAELQSRIDSGELAIQDGLRLVELAGHEAMLGVWRLLVDAGPDRWITTIDRAVDEYTARHAYKTLRAASIARAADTGTELIDPTEVFGPDAPRHRLDSSVDIEAARSGGVLVAAVNGDGELEYYTAAARSQTSPAPQSRQAPAGTPPRLIVTRAREQAAIIMASAAPRLDEAAADIVDAYVDSADAESRHLARRWLLALQIGPAADLPAQPWWQQVRGGRWALRVHAAHALALARSELAVRAHGAWNEDDRSWLRRLIDQAGYVPTAWERDRLRDLTDRPPAARR